MELRTLPGNKEKPGWRGAWSGWAAGGCARQRWPRGPGHSWGAALSVVSWVQHPRPHPAGGPELTPALCGNRNISDVAGRPGRPGTPPRATGPAPLPAPRLSAQTGPELQSRRRWQLPWARAEPDGGWDGESCPRVCGLHLSPRPLVPVTWARPFFSPSLGLPTGGRGERLPAMEGTPRAPAGVASTRRAC